MAYDGLELLPEGSCGLETFADGSDRLNVAVELIEIREASREVLRRGQRQPSLQTAGGTLYRTSATCAMSSSRFWRNSERSLAAVPYATEARFIPKRNSTNSKPKMQTPFSPPKNDQFDRNSARALRWIVAIQVSRFTLCKERKLKLDDFC